MPISDRVRRKIERDFLPEQNDEVIRALETKGLPLINDNDERVHLAILKLAQGDLQKLKQELRAASIDWRDTLMAAGRAMAMRGRGSCVKKEGKPNE